jgi:membrane associated rhomboid family serine protease
MGFYDREYVRRQGPTFLGTVSSQGKVCLWLVIANVVIFVLQTLAPDRGGPDFITETFELAPARVMSGEVWRLVSYAFLHEPGNLFHIFFNMLFLWWFGRDMEGIYGPKEFLAFYLVSALLGGIAFTGWEWYRGEGAPCLGASGAVTAVLVLYALHYPTNQIYIWFVLPIPIWLFVAFQVAQDLFLFVGQHRTRTAVTVHLAGAAFGFLYYKSQLRLLNLLPNLRSWQRSRSRPRLRVYHEEPPVVHGPAPTASADIDEQMEAKLDAVLEKVARSGQGSLTEQEKQILLRASEVYRRRRP